MSRGRYKRPAVEPSRPDYIIGGQTGHRHTEDTPVSLRRMAQQKAQRPTVDSAPPRSALARRSLTDAELELIAEQAEAQSRVGLIRTAEQQELHVTGADRRALQGRPWLPPRPDEAA